MFHDAYWFVNSILLCIWFLIFQLITKHDVLDSKHIVFPHQFLILILNL